MSYLERLRSYEISHSQVFIAGAVLRMALFALPEVVMMLQRRPELSTPLTSFRSSKSALLFSSMTTSFTVCLVKEGVFIYQHGSNPYSGGTFYHVRFRLMPCKF